MSEGIVVRPISVTDLPAKPVEVAATAAERKKLAEAYELVEVKSLTGTVTLEPLGRDVSVEGRVVADIVQTCVVSLVPVEEHIDETFAVRFVRDPNLVPKGTEVVVDPAAPDPPELLDGPSIDVGALVEEYFALAINPYPRAPGAELPPGVTADDDDATASPFAVLASLAKPRGRSG